MNHAKIRLVLADDHPALLAGILHELKPLQSLEIIGTASNSTEIVEILARASCDVLITDYAMPGGQFGDGISFLSFLRRRFPDVNVIVFTMLDNPAITNEMSSLGIKAVLSKSDDVSHLISAIHAVKGGAAYFSPTALSQAGPARTEGAQALSMREAEVVRLYIAGRSVKEIAEQLHRSKQTVSAQKMSAMRKLGIERDADLFRFAYETGLVSKQEESPDIRVDEDS